MPTLTQKQKQIFDFIKSFIDKKGYSPTFEEIKKFLKLKALSGVYQHVNT
ncbi:MAG: repressor LexA, partial [Parcubacteria group bacterium]|nr:repressor LexA [Parcubacteria group bacterium]